MSEPWPPAEAEQPRGALWVLWNEGKGRGQGRKGKKAGGEGGRNMFQTKAQDKSLENDLNGIEIRYLPNKELKIIAIKMLVEVRRAKHEQKENFNEV